MIGIFKPNRPTALRRSARAAIKTKAIVGLLAFAGAAHSATGLVQLPATATHGRVAIVYPSASAPQAVRRMGQEFRLAQDGAPQLGNGRLVVLSHGSGGSPWVQLDLAQALVQRGYTVAMPVHQGDNWGDYADAGPVAWTRRPQEVSQAIDAVAADARFAPLQLDMQRVGVYGMSAGGITALVLAGAQWSPARFAAHCDAHAQDDFALCGGLAMELTGGWLDGFKLWLDRLVVRFKFGDDTQLRSAHDARIAAIVAAVPVAAPIDPATLAPPRVPLGLVRAGRDLWLVPRFHIDAIRPACDAARLPDGPARGQPGCTLLIDMPGAAHGSILSPQPPGLPPRAARVMDDPPGYDRSEIPRAYAAIVQFFDQQLRPGTVPVATASPGRPE